MNKKAVALFSGGLDSTLAIKLVLEQGVEIIGLHFVTPFCTCDKKGCSSSTIKIAQQLDIKVKTISLTDEYFEIVKNPKFGYGSNLNPCIDCRILILKKAKVFMEEIGASFLVTGEVLNQRPMSQRRNTLKLIEKEAGVEGLVLRPLSAKVLEPTIPELEGVVDRNKFLDIVGRSRKVQLSLAREYKIEEYGCPSGGCLLTDPIFSKKMKDLIEHKPNFSLTDVNLLKVGRHFRINDNAKLVVGRNEKENNFLLNIAQPTDPIFLVVNTNGPVGLGKGEFSEEDLYLCSKIVARYSDKISDSIKIKVSKNGYNKEYICDEIISQQELERLRI
jgi:tRNA U34 2-thiouridine synthase MnmA/TrmU